jgi:hypothetical protein
MKAWDIKKHKVEESRYPDPRRRRPVRAQIVGKGKRVGSGGVEKKKKIKTTQGATRVSCDLFFI